MVAATQKLSFLLMWLLLLLLLLSLLLLSSLVVEIAGARVCGVTVGVGRTGFVREGLGLVGWSWSMMLCAFGFGVGGLELVGRSLRVRVWGWWVEMVSGGLCFWVWGWWVGVGWSRVVLEGLGLVGRG